MPLDTATLNRHLNTILGDLPVQFMHKAVVYGPAGVTRGPVDEATRVMAGGLDLKLDSILYVKASILRAAIVVGDIITVGVDKMKVHDIAKSADDGQLLKLTLAWPHL